jgi:CheY-like chemotaxis protein
MLILLAEDSDTVREALSKQIRALGHDVHSVSNGWHAVLSYHAHRYDLMLMDMHMPVMDGWDATNFIRDLESAQGIPAVPIVAITSLFDRQACLAGGLSDHIRKPVGAMQLQALLRHWQRKISAGESANSSAEQAGEAQAAFDSVDIHI